MLPRRARTLLVVALALCALVALVALVVEVVAPPGAGPPVGWGQYHDSAHHLQVGAPPLWNVVVDNSQGAVNSCALAVVASPMSEPALSARRDAMRAPRWMGVSGCDSGAGVGAHASLWQPNGQTVVVAGQRVPVQMETGAAPQISERVVVSLRGYTCIFMLHESAATHAQQDMPDVLTFVRSFRYAS